MKRLGVLLVCILAGYACGGGDSNDGMALGPAGTPGAGASTNPLGPGSALAPNPAYNAPGGLAPGGTAAPPTAPIMTPAPVTTPVMTPVTEPFPMSPGASPTGAGTGGVMGSSPSTPGVAGGGTSMGGVGGGMGAGGAPIETGPPSMIGEADPIIPEVSGDCPNWTGGNINFMGLGGIQVEVGAMPSGPTAPMVFYWHGTGSFSGEFVGSAAQVFRGVTSEGGILVSFQGSTGGDLLSGTSVFGRGDLDIVDQMVACAIRDRNVDPRQIYTTGCSAGGLFAAAMATLRSNYVAAAAPNSGGWTLPLAFQGSYTPALMTMHGAPGRDVVIVDFSDTSASADMGFKNHGGFVVNCNHGGGHCGASGLSGEAWKFFKAHPYGVFPYPWEDGLPAGFNSACKIY